MNKEDCIGQLLDSLESCKSCDKRIQCIEQTNIVEKELMPQDKYKYYKIMINGLEVKLQADCILQDYKEKLKLWYHIFYKDGIAVCKIPSSLIQNLILLNDENF